MKMKWKWKRPAAFLLAAAMIFTMPGIPVFAMETDTSAVHKGLCDHTSGFTDGVATAASGTATYTTDFAALVTTADGTQAYGSFDEAWNKAIASEGSTLKLLSDVTLPAVNDGLSVSEGSFTLDLNNKTLDGGIWNQLLEVSGTANITIKNGSLVNTQTGSSGSATQTNLIALEISGGTVALENVNLTSGIIDNDEYAYALYITGGSLTVNGSTFTGEVRVLCENSSTRPALSIKDAALNNGIFYGVCGTKESDAAGLKAIFADGSMLFDQNSKYIDLTKEDYWMIEPEGACFLYTEKCIVKPHTHEVVDGVCECGAAFAAGVTQNGTVTYYKDFNAALAAANAGDTLTLLKDVTGGFTVTIDKAIILDLNGHEIYYNLTVNSKITIKDSSGGKGKIVQWLIVGDGLTVGDLLEADYAFREADNSKLWYYGTNKAVGNVTVQQVPITAVTLRTVDADGKDVTTTIPYGTTGGIKLSASCATPGAGESSAGEPSCQWYTVGGSRWPIDGATGTEYDLPADLSVGTYRYLVTFTADGYSMSKEITITVTPTTIPVVTAPVANTLTYNGAEQALVTAGSAANHGTMQYSLTENGTYSQDIPTGTDAGEYTVWYRVIGDANHNDTAPASVVVSIGKKPLTITGVTAASKSYDGTTNADISSVTFDGVTLKRGTDYTVTASFDDASVGNSKSITATVTLMEQTAKNYALEQSSFTTTGSITRVAAPDFIRETALVIVNGCEKTYTVTIPTLPTLENPKEYGALTYEIGEIRLNGGYYTSGAKVENGELTLPIQKNDVETTGSVGTATVVIKSTNYEDITLTVNISAENRHIPAVTAPTANALTYNGAKQALVTAGKTTGGTMLYRLDDSKWSEQIPTAKNAKEYTVWYKVQGDAEYADVAEQSLSVTVAKKAVNVTALDKSAYTGSTAPDLSSPEADKDYKMEGLVGADTLSGTVILTYEQTPDMSKTGKTAINITGTLSNDNYEITYIPGTLTVTDGDEPAPKPTPEPTPNPTPVDQNIQKAQENVKRLLAQADELLRAGQGSYDDASWRAFTAAYEAAKKGGNDVASLQKLADALTAAQSNLTLKNGTAVTDATGVFTYKVTGADTVEVTGITEKGKKKAAVKISSTMKGNGRTYKITSVAANALKGNKKMTSLTIGNNVVTIGKNAFANCTKLKKVTVNGNKLKTIGKNAFSGDKKLKTINMKKVKSLKTVGKSAFKGISKKVTVKVPGAKKAAYKRLFKKGGIAANRIK